MAYHYAFNIYNGDLRRIRTESVISYRNTSDWKVYDTEAERDAAHPAWYAGCYSYPSHGIERIFNPAEAAHRWGASYLKAGYFLASNLATAEQMLKDMPQRFAVNPNSGDVMRIPMWLAPEDRHIPDGYEGEYESEREARASLPEPLYCIYIRNGDMTRIYPERAAELSTARRDYAIGATMEEALAKCPVRWTWNSDTLKYERAYGRAMGRTSTYTLNRIALLAANNGLASYREQGREYSSHSGILSICKMFMQKGAPEPYRGYDDNPAWHEYRAQRRIEFVQRVQSRWPNAGVALCNCGDSIVTRFNGEYEGQKICDICAQQYVRCIHCSTLMEPQEALQDENENYVCRAHWTRPIERAGVLLNYSVDITKRRECFLTAPGEAKTSLWMGWELEAHATGDGGMIYDDECERCGGAGTYEDDDGDECDCDCGTRGGNVSEAVKRIQQSAGNWAIAKADGSLNQNGLEIVSVPASLAWHRANVVPFLEEAKGFLSGWPHSDCGIHVHVGRDQLSRLTQGKLVAFMHEPTHQEFITKVAGRAPGSYCVRGEVKKKIPAYRYEDSHGRYQALNFATRGKKTIEFRIFRSNVSPAGFMKNLEFVHALCHWAKYSSARQFERGNMVQDFLVWVKHNRHDYPALVRYFEKDGLLPAPRIHPDANVPNFILAA